VPLTLSQPWERGAGGEGVSKEKPPKALHSFGGFGALSGSVAPLCRVDGLEVDGSLEHKIKGQESA
jgi:hypothetical protein